MIRDITIEGYRCFERLEIPKLTRVNLIVGENNSGKSSALEAAQLLVSMGATEPLESILQRRNEIASKEANALESSQYEIQHLFHGHTLSPESEVTIMCKSSWKTRLRIYLRTLGREIPDLPELLDPRITDEFVMEWNGSHVTLPRYRNTITMRHSGYFGDDHQTSRMRYIRPGDESLRRIEEVWELVALTPHEKKVEEALRIIDPTVEKCAVIAGRYQKTDVFVKCSTHDSRLPLGILGDGMRNIFVIISMMAGLQKGYFFVDEIDTGLHYSTITSLWSLLFQLSEEMDTQVFATTHSLDCIRAFAAALEKSPHREEGSIVRISRRNGGHHAVIYDHNEAIIAAEHDIEVR